MRGSKTIMIISGDDPITKLLSISLRDNDYKLVTELGGESGTAAAASVKPDLILLDIDNGFSDQNTLKNLKYWYSNPVIVLSAINKESEIVLALDNGANDYITKPFRIPELLARIRLALRLKKNRNEARISYGDLSIDFAHRLVKVKNSFLKLSPTEYTLLALLARHEGRILTNTFLTHKIWGEAQPDALKDLRVYIGRLRKKIEVKSNDSVQIQTETGIGYKFISTNDTSD